MWRVVDVFLDAMVVGGTLPLLLILFGIGRWMGAFMWCTMVLYLLYEVHPELHGCAAN